MPTFDQIVHAKAIEIGKLAVRATTAAGSGHPSTCLSLAHLTTVLMYHVMRWDPEHPQHHGSDRLVLSEGHAVPIIYAACADIGVTFYPGGKAKIMNTDDLMTLREHFDTLDGRIIAYVGDGNNVATSLAHACAMQGMTVHVASPAGYELPTRVREQVARVAAGGGSLKLFSNPREAVRGASAIYTDVWTSMGQEDETTERLRAFKGFQVNDALMRAAEPDAIFMHCLPAHRGEEVSASVVESPASVVFDQAENRLHAQKALLALLFE